jgi:hypothetical protein
MDTTYSLKLPPKNYRRTIEELSVTIPDPVLKLKFLKQAINEYQKISSQSNLRPPIAEITFQKKLLDNAEELWPGSKKAAENLIRKDVITTPDIKSRWVYKLRYAIGSAILIVFILGVGTAVSPLVSNFNLGARISTNNQQAKPPNTKIIIRKPVFYSRPSNGGINPPSSIVKSVNSQNGPEQVPEFLQNPILAVLAASPQNQNATSNHISKKPFLSSRPSEGESHSSSPIVISAKRQNEAELVLKYFQNPMLLALAPQKAINTKLDQITRKPLGSSQPSESEKHLPSSIVRSAKHQNEPEQVPEFLQNPILAALTASPQNQNATSDRIPRRPILSPRPPEGQKRSSSPAVKIVNYQIEIEQVPEYLQNPIWLVEKTSDREIYSNRLQIITTHTIPNVPREYYRFSKRSKHLPANSKITDKISGIVYHASESDLYPFMPEMNHSILKYSKQLIKFLLRKQSYHFFIDRFGRVYRLVQEDHAAFHAGNSIWADDQEIYLNLNHAFIGICFEGKDFEEIKISRQQTNSNPARLKPTGISSFNEAQLRSGKELTDWLRIKYNIPQQNCVPHALISVNPDKMLIGFHLDLSRGFPFAKFGLSDKYQEPLPSMVEFGFLYDGYFEKIFNGELWRGIGYSQEILQRQAANSGMSVAEYRKGLHRRFSRLVDWKKEMHEKRAHLVNNHQKTMGTKTP